MTRTIKYLTASLWLLAVLATVTVVAAYYRGRDPSDAGTTTSPQATVGPVDTIDLSTKLFPVPAFALKDVDDKLVTQESLVGRPWVAAFVFTHCSGTCPIMSNHMATLQTKITNKDVRLVSFTLDPERDTPAVLKSYARKFNADASRWFFLTGTDRQMQDVARGMKIAVEGKAPGTDQIIHSSKFLLVDRTNTIRGIYDGTDAATLDKLATDAETLAKE